MDPPTPHDAVVKSIFGDPAHAAGELRHILPAAISALFLWDTLNVVPGSFVEEALRETHSDILFKIRCRGTNKEVLVYLLFEHQSTDRPLMALVLLRYIVRIWDKHLAANPETDKLPAILPMVLHHSERGWTASRSLHGLLDLAPEDLPLFARFIPAFEYLLDDLSDQPDEALRARAMTALGRLALYCLRHAREPWVLVGHLIKWLDLIREVQAAPGGRGALRKIWRYIFVTTNPADPKLLVEHLVDVVGKESEDDVMTVADWLRSEGLDEGSKKMGRKTLLKLLRARFGEVPAEAEKRIQAAGEEQLDAWLDRVISARSLDEVLTAS